MMTSSNKNKDIFEIILDTGLANINLKDENGKTALSMAFDWII